MDWKSTQYWQKGLIISVLVYLLLLPFLILFYFIRTSFNSSEAEISHIPFIVSSFENLAFVLALGALLGWVYGKISRSQKLRKKNSKKEKFFTLTKSKFLATLILLFITQIAQYFSLGCMFGGGAMCYILSAVLAILLIYPIANFLINPPAFVYTLDIVGVYTVISSILLMIIQILWAYLLACLIHSLYNKAKSGNKKKK